MKNDFCEMLLSGYHCSVGSAALTLLQLEKHFSNGIARGFEDVLKLEPKKHQKE